MKSFPSRFLHLGTSVAVALAFAACTASEQPALTGTADAIYFGGDILTMEGDSAQYAEAVVVDSGRIVFVGAKQEALKYQGDSTAMHDLKGTTLMPGFIDPHLHPILGAVILNAKFASPFDWNFPWGKVDAVRGHDAFIAKAKAYDAALTDPTEPLVVWGYMEPFHGRMSRAELDSLFAVRPVVVWQYSAHEMFFNTAALKTYGISEADTKGNSQIDYALGRFVEAGFFTVALPKLGPSLMGKEAMREGLERFRAVTHLGGITTVGDMALGSSGSCDGDLAFIAPVLESSGTPFRIQFTPDLNTVGLQLGDGAKAIAYVKALEQKGTPHLLMGHSIKLFSDGAFFGQAFQVEPPGYKDGHHGEWIMQPERLEKTLRLWWNEGYTIHIHCNGGGGLTAILDALEKVQKETPKQDHRLTIEHFGQSSAQQAERIAALGAVVSANPYYLYAMGDQYAAGNLGMERASEMVRLGSLLKNKVPFALHTDFTMAPLEPLLLAWVAVNRVTAEGTVMAPQERVPVYAALQAITSNAAFVLRMEDQIGSMAVGKKADFVHLEKNPMTIDPMHLKDIKVLGTVFEGHAFAL